MKILSLELIAKILANTEKFEGRIPWMYQDTTGNVTVGIGHVLARPRHALMLRWEAPEGNEISADDAWMLTKAMAKGRLAAEYAQASELRLSDRSIEDLFNCDVFRVRGELTAMFPEIGNIPDCAFLALFDMAFNMGPESLLRFPKLMQAIRTEQWKIAARESWRKGVSDARNEYVKGLLLSC